jgi:hypothetical protein
VAPARQRRTAGEKPAKIGRDYFHRLQGESSLYKKGCREESEILENYRGSFEQIRLELGVPKPLELIDPAVLVEADKMEHSSTLE